MIKIKTKKRFLIMLAAMAIFISVLSSPSVIDAVASKEKTEKKYDKKVDKYTEKFEEPEEMISDMFDDFEENTEAGENDLLFVMKRLFLPGYYLNNVSTGVIDKDLGKAKDFMYDGVHACNPNSPNSLINHNCNIPNFTTELVQTIAGAFYTPFEGANKTSAKAAFGLGVPVGLPEDGVPVNPSKNGDSFTALEMYGYDLKLTRYNGEWDRISVSTKARMLSNFGFFDHTKVWGNMFWEGAKGGLAGAVSFFNFNSNNFLRPIKTATSIFNGIFGSSLKVLVDTSELNIIATKAWKREQMNGSLYNVYVLSDREMLSETSANLFRTWSKIMNDNIDSDPELKKVMTLEKIPEFTYDPELESEESIQARLDAEEFNKQEDAKKAAAEDAIRRYDKMYEDVIRPPGGNPPKEYTPQYKDIPEKVFYTEAEQLQLLWLVANSEMIEMAREESLISKKDEELENYEAITSEWNESWEIYKTKSFAAEGKKIQKLAEESDDELYINNPHLDTRQGIGHYACESPNGGPMRKEDGSLEYLYLLNGALNSKCKKPRDTIGGGFLGDGWHVKRDIDTRHISSVNEGGGMHKKTTGVFISLFRSLNSFIAKVTNVVLGFSFSPILSALGVDTIVSTMVEGFRDTIFFPMSTLAAALGGILIFIQLLKNGSAWELLLGLFLSFLIFVAGATFLLHPDAVIKLADEWPSAIDNFVADTVLGGDSGSTYCSTGESKNGIRSAQCNVWGSMVFNPWVHLQFGTGYNNLYANGYAPDGANEMKNTNTELVGDAEVNMGGGVTVNNWAMYQLSKTKTGSITTSNKSNSTAIGMIDKDMYRLVDLQAGPNNAEKSDSRYFDSWSGGSASQSFGTLLISTLNAGIMGFAIMGLGVKKIEASFIFAMMLIFLPIMLLYALLPKGKLKLKEYLGALGGLLLKRVMVTVILSALLAMMSGIGANATDLATSSMTGIALSIVFIMYGKELLELTTSSPGSETARQEMKEALSNSIPQDVKHNYQMKKAKLKGRVYGAAGGLAGAIGYNVGNAKDEFLIASRIAKLEDKSSKGKLDKEGQEELEELRIKSEDIYNRKEFNRNTRSNSLIKAMKDGSEQSGNIIGRRQELKIRRSGQGMGKILSEATSEVIEKGGESIQDNREPVELDVYKDIISTGDTPQNTKTTSEELDAENKSLLLNPRVQKLVRKEAEMRRQKLKEDKKSEAVSKDDLDMDKLREIVEDRRKRNRFKNRVFDRKTERERKKAIDENTKDKANITSNAELIKEQIIAHQEEEKAKRDRKKLEKEMKTRADAWKNRGSNEEEAYEYEVEVEETDEETGDE